MIREYLVKKKPLILKAVEFTRELTDEELQRWSNKNAFIAHFDRDEEPCVVIKTLEGTIKAQYGDWIVQGVNGEFYPVNKDIMPKLYDFMRD